MIGRSRALCPCKTNVFLTLDAHYIFLKADQILQKMQPWKTEPNMKHWKLQETLWNIGNCKISITQTDKKAHKLFKNRAYSSIILFKSTNSVKWRFKTKLMECVTHIWRVKESEYTLMIVDNETTRTIKSSKQKLYYLTAPSNENPNYRLQSKLTNGLMEHTDFWIWDRHKKHTSVGRYGAKCTCEEKEVPFFN